MSDSTITVVGNLTRDPELRYTTGGRAAVNFGLAVNRRFQSNGTWQEQTSFLDVVAWGSLGENLASCVTKGARIIVTGRLEQRSWENQEGEKRSKVEIVADDAGPSLRWATADITRNERTQMGDASGGGGYDPGPEPAFENDPFPAGA